MSVPRYFKPSAALMDGSPAPAPLSVTVTRLVRFNEVDPLNVVWHGHYASYFEDARVAFGRQYGFGYRDMHGAGFVAPVKQMHIDYEVSLRFDQECRITASLFWSEAARLNFEYVITDREGCVTTRGYTVQLFVSLEGGLFYAKPDLYEAFCARWRAGSV